MTRGLFLVCSATPQMTDCMAEPASDRFYEDVIMFKLHSAQSGYHLRYQSW
jgi:hypothetical protein